MQEDGDNAVERNIVMQNKEITCVSCYLFLAVTVHVKAQIRQNRIKIPNGVEYAGG